MANLALNKKTQIEDTDCSLEDLVNRFKSVLIAVINNGSSSTIYSGLNRFRRTYIINITLFGDNVERSLLYSVYWTNQWGTGAVLISDWAYNGNSANITVSYVKSDRGPSFSIVNNSGVTISGNMKIICFDKI